MTTFLLMSFAVLQYIPFDQGQEALLIRAPELTTSTWGVFDPFTGSVRYGSDVDTVTPIASITKLFTAYAVLESGKGPSTTRILWSDVNAEGRAGKLVYNETYTLDELLFPLLIESSNDAGTALARVLGEQYSEVIATLSQSESLTATHIADGTGLSKDNTSTIRDLARFYAHVSERYPRITDITQLRMYLGQHGGLLNNDPLRTFPEFRGGKHGYTPEAGKTFVGTFSLSSGRQVGIVLLGSTDLEKDTRAILGALR